MKKKATKTKFRSYIDMRDMMTNTILEGFKTLNFIDKNITHLQLYSKTNNNDSGEFIHIGTPYDEIREIAINASQKVHNLITGTMNSRLQNLPEDVRLDILKYLVDDISTIIVENCNYAEIMEQIDDRS